MSAIDIFFIVVLTYVLIGMASFNHFHRVYHTPMQSIKYVLLWLPLSIRDLCSFLQSARKYHQLKKVLKEHEQREQWKRNNDLY